MLGHDPTVRVHRDGMGSIFTVYAFLTLCLTSSVSLCVTQTDGELVSNHHPAGLLLRLLCLPQRQYQAGHDYIFYKLQMKNTNA